MDTKYFQAAVDEWCKKHGISTTEQGNQSAMNCTQCGEPIVKNPKLGVWAHLLPGFHDHWASPGRPCQCGAEVYDDHAPLCDALLTNEDRKD